jgi:hypothetical protein
MIHAPLGSTSSAYSPQHVRFSAKEKQKKNRETGLEQTASPLSGTSTSADETSQGINTGRRGTSAGLWTKRAGLLALGLSASGIGAAPENVSGEGRRMLVNPNQVLLKKPPYAPKNVNLLRFPAYPTAIVYAPSKSLPSAWSGANLKPTITKTMAKLYQAMNPSLDLATATSRGKNATLVIDDPIIKKYIPDIRLRTTLALLKGTAADSAINTIKSGVFNNVSFVELDPGLQGISVTLSDGTIAAWINSRYQHEDPRLIAPILAHEIFHQNINNSLTEEIICHASDTMIYGQHVLADATLPLQKTELTQRVNMKLMARTNCRDAGTGNLRITSCNGDNLYPNSNITVKSFADALTPTNSTKPNPTTEGNNYLRAISQRLTGQDLGKDVNFSNATLARLDKNQKLFNYNQIVKIARNLKLDVDA